MESLAKSGVNFACEESAALCRCIDTQTCQDNPSVGGVNHLGKQAACLERDVLAETIPPENAVEA